MTQEEDPNETYRKWLAELVKDAYYKLKLKKEDVVIGLLNKAIKEEKKFDV